MDVRLFLSKILMLIYRTREIGVESYDSVIIDSLDNVKLNDKEDGFLNEGMSKKLLEFVHSLLEQKEPINLNNLMLSLEVMLDNDPKLLKIITRSLSQELDEKEIKKVIQSLYGEIMNFNKEKKLLSIVSRMSYDLKFNKSNIGDLFAYVKESMSEMEPLTSNTTGRDPAIVREVRIGNKEDVANMYKDVKKQVDMSAVYKSGWQGFNRMTQGGLRPAESVGLGAMKHNYKTGTSLSLFLQILRLNKPILRDVDKGKKPIAIRISLEDALENNFQFAFQYLKGNNGEFIKPSDIEKIDEEVIAEYVSNELTKTGFEVLMLRVNPSEWGYSELFNFIVGLEAEGYTIRICMIDYLLMMQTTGCTHGPAGTEKRDLLRRVRNFFSARGTLFVTPLQLSQEAMNLLRNGVTPARFLKEIAGKDYTADSRQLSHDFDLEIYCHIVRQQDRAFLSLGRGKHRLPSEIEKEEWKFFYLPFPGPSLPVLEDVNGDDTTLYTLPRSGTSFGAGSEGMLDEILG